MWRRCRSTESWQRKTLRPYRPYVATTLNNLAILDCNQSGLEEARKEFAETLQIYEGLAKQNPERFSRDVERVKKLLTKLPN